MGNLHADILPVNRHVKGMIVRGIRLIPLTNIPLTVLWFRFPMRVRFWRWSLPKNPRNFALFAEGPLDEIRKLQAEIDQYLSRLEAAPV